MATFQEIIQRVQVRLRMANGVDVQTYAQPVIAEFVQYSFTQLFDRRWWKRHRRESIHVLGNGTGLVVDDLSSLIKLYEDLRYVFIEDSNGKTLQTSPLPEVVNNVNITQVSLTSIQPWGDPTKVFRVLPLTVTGQVRLIYRTRPNKFTDNDEVPFDEDCLVLAAAFEYASDDATNPRQIERLQSMLAARIDRLEKMEDQQQKSLYSYDSSGLNEWRDR